MIIFYFSDSKQILNSITGFDPVTITGGKAYVNNLVMLNQTSGIDWKYVADQMLEWDDEGHFLHDADYYVEYDPDPTDHELVMAMANILAAELNP